MYKLNATGLKVFLFASKKNKSLELHFKLEHLFMWVTALLATSNTSNVFLINTIHTNHMCIISSMQNFNF